MARAPESISRHRAVKGSISYSGPECIYSIVQLSVYRKWAGAALYLILEYFGKTPEVGSEITGDGTINCTTSAFRENRLVSRRRDEERGRMN